MVYDLFLKNVRCFKEKRVDFPLETPVLIVGDNGSGKTTILESILLAGYGFLYGARASTFIRKGETEAFLLLNWVDENTDHEIKVEVKGTHREIFLDKKKKDSISIRDLTSFSWFFPQDILLTLGSSEERRRYLDETISMAYSSYRNVLNIYRQAVKQRNIALRKNADDREIDVYDQQIASAGTRIIKKRMAEVAILNEIFSKIAFELIEQKSSISYFPKALRSEEIEESLIEMLYVSRETDRKEGVTSTGPHRDPVEIIFDERQARNASSYGERKIISLALKLSQREYLQRVCQKNVGFLADDLFSELVCKRRQSIMNYLIDKGIYTIATTTEKAVDNCVYLEVFKAEKDSVIH